MLHPAYREPLEYLLTDRRLYDAVELIRGGTIEQKTLSSALSLASGLSGIYEYEFIAMLLISLKVLVNNVDEAGEMTALHGAARGGSVNTVKMLLAVGADSNLPTRGGYTVLHEALGMSSGSEEKMKLIITAGGNLFAKCETGDNPAELALKMGRIESADFLGNQMVIAGLDGGNFDGLLS